MNNYDVIIIGAGPAGIVAANLLSHKGVSVLMLEKGKDLLRRRDLMSGWFGRGLFGTHRLKLSDPALRNKKVFKEAVVMVQKITSWDVDLSQKQYCEPPADFGRELAAHFYDNIIEKANIDVLFTAEAKTIEKINKQVVVKTNRGEFRSKRCIIATGSYSIEWLSEICKDLDIICHHTETEIGVRVEIPASLASRNIDPEEDIETVESHCTDITQRSFVTEWEESGILSAFGCQIPGKHSDKTNFMVGFKPNMDSDEVIRTIKITNVLANDKIRRERVQDYMENRSILQHLDLFNGLYKAFSELHEAIPSFINYAMMYIPEIKLTGILPVNAKMVAGVSGIYGAGECTTRVTTLLGAMASGLIVARTILGE